MRRAVLIVLVAALALLAIPTSAAELKRVRLGTDGATTRIVVETTRSLPALVAQPAPTRLDLTVAATLAKRPELDRRLGLVASLVAEPLSGGRTKLHLSLREPARVVAAFALAPGASGLHRYVVDLAPVAAPAAAVPQAAAAAVAAAPARLALARPPLRRPDTSATPAPRPVVVIDPGHGGIDPGALGTGGLREKDVTLAVAHRLAARLEAAGNVAVVLTRTGDASLTLARRRDLAAEARADLFVSLHADSLPDHPEVRGASVYTLSQQPSDPEAARRAQEENAADERLQVIAAQPDETVRAILTSIMRTSTTQRSIAAAERLTDGLGTVTPLVARAQRSANFAVLRSLHTPSVLVELGYLSNPEDERQLADPGHLDQLAAALQRAVESHFGIE